MNNNNIRFFFLDIFAIVNIYVIKHLQYLIFISLNIIQVSVSVNVFDSKGSRSGHFPVGGEAPGYIALSDDGQKIAVSDWKLNQVGSFVGFFFVIN